MQRSAWFPGATLLVSTGFSLSVLLGCGGLLGGSSSTGESQGGTGSIGGAGAGGSGAASASTAGPGTGGTGTGGQSSTDADDCPSDDYCCTLLVQSSCKGIDKFKADVRTVNMLLVVDASALMNNTAQTSDTQSRWTTLNAQLGPTLRRFGNDINFGLEIFPYSPSGIDPNAADPAVACELPSASTATPRIDSLYNLLTMLNSQQPAGYSPASQALEQAYVYFTAGAGKDLAGSRSVIFVTTGGTDCNSNLSCGINTCVPNLDQSCPQGDAGVNCCSNAGYFCSDHIAVTAEISKLASAGIKTYVVGMPAGYNELQILNTFATAGQATNATGTQGELFYWVGEGRSGPDDLMTALATVTTQLIRTCDFALTSVPSDVNGIVVALDCNIVSQVAPDAVDSGWFLDWSQDPPHVVLTGTYCTRIQAAGVNSVSIIYNCSR